MRKNLIKKILKEQLEQEDKLYKLFKQIYYMNFDDNIGLTSQIFIDNSRRTYFLSSGKEITRGEDCFNQPYCRCHMLKDNIDWTEHMIKKRRDWLDELDEKINEKNEFDITFDIVPYNIMHYNFSGYECMYLYGRLLRELYTEYKC